MSNMFLNLANFREMTLLDGVGSCLCYTSQKIDDAGAMYPPVIVILRSTFHKMQGCFYWNLENQAGYILPGLNDISFPVKQRSAA